MRHDLQLPSRWKTPAAGGLQLWGLSIGIIYRDRSCRGHTPAPRPQSRRSCRPALPPARVLSFCCTLLSLQSAFQRVMAGEGGLSQMTELAAGYVRRRDEGGLRGEAGGEGGGSQRRASRPRGAAMVRARTHPCVRLPAASIFIVCRRPRNLSETVWVLQTARCAARVLLAVRSAPRLRGGCGLGWSSDSRRRSVARGVLQQLHGREARESGPGAQRRCHTLIHAHIITLSRLSGKKITRVPCAIFF